MFNILFLAFSKSVSNEDANDKLKDIIMDP